jgi:cell division protein FtsB
LIATRHRHARTLSHVHSELELRLSSLDKELEVLKRERDRFERQATNLTQKYKAVDVDLYNDLQV